MHQQYKFLLYICTRSEVGRLVRELWLELELFYMCSYTSMFWFRHVTFLPAVSLEECLYEKYTHFIHQHYNGCLFHTTLMCL